MQRSDRKFLFLTAGLAAAAGATLLWTLGGTPAAPAGSAPTATVAGAHGAEGAGGASLGRDRQAVPGDAIGAYGAPVGSHLVYSIDGRYAFGVGHDDGGDRSAGITLQGDVDVTIVARAADGSCVARIAFPGLTLSGDGRTLDAQADALRRPCDVLVHPDGRLGGLRFTQGQDPEQRNFLRGLLTAWFHRVHPDDVTGPAADVAERDWETEGTDSTGTYAARMRRSLVADAAGSGGAPAMAVSRTRLRYVAMGGGKLRPHRLSGMSTARFAPASGWLGEVDVDESTELTLEELGGAVHVHAKLSFRPRSADRVAVAVEGDPFDPDLGWAPVDGHADSALVDSAARDVQSRSKAIEGLRLQDLVAELEMLLAADPVDAEAVDAAWKKLQWMIQSRPEVVAEIRAGIRSGISEGVVDMLLSALGAAGTEVAQAALADIRRDGSAPEALRHSATLSLLQSAQPSERVLHDLVVDVTNAPELVGQDALAMLALGALAPRADGIAIDGRTPMDALFSFETEADRQGRLDLWLDALGNTRSPAIVGRVARLHDHADERVRASAYHALRNVPSAEAVAVLERGLQDPSPAVRIEAVSALGEQGTPAAGAILVRAAEGDTDATVRRAAVLALAGFAVEPGVRAALQRIAAQDADAETRAAARAVLDGQ